MLFTFFILPNLIQTKWKYCRQTCGWKNSQQPVNSNKQTDILGWQAHSGEDQKHSHQSGTGDTGCSNTGQGGCQTGRKESNRTRRSLLCTCGSSPFCHSLLERLYWTAAHKWLSSRRCLGEVDDSGRRKWSAVNCKSRWVEQYSAQCQAEGRPSVGLLVGVGVEIRGAFTELHSLSVGFAFAAVAGTCCCFLLVVY